MNPIKYQINIYVTKSRQKKDIFNKSETQSRKIKRYKLPVVMQTRSKYFKEKDVEQTKALENEMRIDTRKEASQFVRKGMWLLLGTKGDAEAKPFDTIIISAIDNAIPKALMIVEVLIRRVVDLYQVHTIGHATITEHYTPTEEGLLPVTFKQLLTSLTIKLTRKPTEEDKKSSGFHLPLDASQVQDINNKPQRGDGNRGGDRRQRGGDRRGDNYRGDDRRDNSRRDDSRRDDTRRNDTRREDDRREGGDRRTEGNRDQQRTIRGTGQDRRDNNQRGERRENNQGGERREYNQGGERRENNQGGERRENNQRGQDRGGRQTQN